MKKIYLFLLAAASVFAVASCEQAEMEEPMPVNPEEVTTLTLAFDATRTTLVDGKTAWVAGDKVRIYNSTGTFYNDVTISEADAGKTSIEVEVNMKDNAYYAVYPVESANGISSGKIGIKIPSNPDGLFASANICVAQTGEGGTTLRMRNATAILKLKVNSGNVVEILQFNAQNTMTGTFTVDLSGDAPALTMVSGSKAATVAVGGVDGDYYIPVAPGTYAENFTATALRGNGGYQTLTSTKANEIALNTIVDMGSIGSSLSTGLTGEGTEGNPYVINNLGEWTAFSASVNLGQPYTGQIISLQADITEPVTKPVGYYISDDTQFPFRGIFKGNNHTVTLNIDGANCESPDEIGLFGNVSNGAVISDLTVDGTVTSEGVDVGGIVGWAHGTAEDQVKLTNLTNKATITTSNICAGGVVAYAYQTSIDNCKNLEKVTSTATAGSGMFFPAGNNYSASNYNSGTGGVVGWAQNSVIKNCSNSAAIAGFNKVGGVAGTTYWTAVDKATNSGNITGNGYYEGNNIGSQMQCCFGSAAGGVIGWVHTSGAITNCSNTGNVVGKTGIGGVVGFANGSQSAKPMFENLTNSGIVAANVDGTGKSHPRGIGGFNAGTGGIIGTLLTFASQASNVIKCHNSGDVSSPNVNTGGILGLCGDHGNATKPAYKQIDQCVNDGNVTGGPYWVGGIIGYCFSRYVGRQTVKNCANHGTITGTRASGNGTVAGGIIGGIGANVSTYLTSSDHLQLYNCYNDGDVVYSSTALTVPYVGGIMGNLTTNSSFQNNYNRGYVGRSDHAEPTAAELMFMGELIGRQSANYAHFSYYPKTKVGPVGTDGTAARVDTVIDYDEEGTLSATVTVNNKSCTTLLDALNEWQNSYVKSNYFNWTGPANHPVHATTMD